MAPLVLQLQQDALDRNISVTDLLRKALVVATKLQLPDFEAWIRRELDGYPMDAEVPPYRKIQGQLRGWNPYRGWLPVYFSDASTVERLSSRPTVQSIAEIEDLRAGGSDELTMPFDPATEQRLQRATGEKTSFTVFVPGSALSGIVAAVRNAVLNWTLELEQKGVLGEGLSFTPEERRAAAQAPTPTAIFYGPVGSAQIQQSSPRAIQISGSPLDFEQLKRFLDGLKAKLADLPPSGQATVSADVATIEAQLSAPVPKPSIIRECLGSIVRVLEQAAGNLVAQALLGQLGPLLGPTLGGI
jgi:hypothetical protein